MVGVTGSIPVAPTKNNKYLALYVRSVVDRGCRSVASRPGPHHIEPEISSRQDDRLTGGVECNAGDDMCSLPAKRNQALRPSIVGEVRLIHADTPSILASPCAQ